MSPSATPVDPLPDNLTGIVDKLNFSGNKAVLREAWEEADSPKGEATRDPGGAVYLICMQGQSSSREATPSWKRAQWGCGWGYVATYYACPPRFWAS